MKYNKIIIGINILIFILLTVNVNQTAGGGEHRPTAIMMMTGGNSLVQIIANIISAGIASVSGRGEIGKTFLKSVTIIAIITIPTCIANNYL